MSNHHLMLFEPGVQWLDDIPVPGYCIPVTLLDAEVAKD